MLKWQLSKEILISSNKKKSKEILINFTQIKSQEGGYYLLGSVGWVT